MRVRGGALASLLVALGCGRTGLELDDTGSSSTAGAGGHAAPGGRGGGSAGGRELDSCAAAFASNEPSGDVVSTFSSVRVGFACANAGRVDPATVSVHVESALGPVEGELSWDPVSLTLTLAPASPLALATRYTATAVVPGAELVWSFQTTDGAWLLEEELGTGGDIALAVSPDGHGLVGFQAGGTARLRRFTLQDGLAAKAERLSGWSVVPRSLKLGVANGGDALVVFESETGDLIARSASIGQSFELGASFPGPLGVPMTIEDFALASDGSGVALVSLRDDASSPAALHAVNIGRSTDGLPAPLYPRLSLASQMPLDTVRAVARPGGEYWAVWSSWSTTGRILARRSDGTGDPDAEVVVREPAARAGFAAMRPDGSVLVIWEEGSPPHSVRAAGVTSEGEVEPETALDTGVAGVPSSGIYARIAVDQLGRALALWVNQGETAAGTLEEIRAQRFDGRWAVEHVALGESTIDEWAVISPMGLVLDRHGNGFSGFGHGDPARAWVRRFRETSGWQAPVPLSESATAPLLAVDAAGRAAVAWASGGKVYLRRFIELTAPRPRH